MSSNSPYSISLFTYGYKESSSVVTTRFLALFDASFHYPENVGKYNVTFQICRNLLLRQHGENIRYSAQYHNPLILSEGTHGGCHGPHY